MQGFSGIAGCPIISARMDYSPKYCCDLAAADLTFWRQIEQMLEFIFTLFAFLVLGSGAFLSAMKLFDLVLSSSL